MHHQFRNLLGAPILGCAALLMTGGPARADTVKHFEDGVGGPNLSPLLGRLGLNSAQYETAASVFKVPGSGPVNLTFTQELDFGTFLFEFGAYDVSRVTANPVTDKRTYATQALANAVPIFNDRTSDPGATKTVTLTGGTTLGFFIVPDNTIAAFNANPGAFYPPSTANDPFRAPLFSIADANPGQFDQLLAFAGNGRTLFTFEDLSRAGQTDNSFTDLAFSIDAQLVPATPVPEPASLATALMGGTLCVLGARIRSRALSRPS